MFKALDNQGQPHWLHRDGDGEIFFSKEQNGAVQFGQGSAFFMHMMLYAMFPLRGLHSVTYV